MHSIVSQPIVAEAGIVSTQAHMIFVASPQRTAFSRWMAPTPAMEPATTWVVEIGRPKRVAKSMDNAAAVSAQTPLRGRSRVNRDPIVCTMRQPPLSVPKEIAL